MPPNSGELVGRGDWCQMSSNFGRRDRTSVQRPGSGCPPVVAQNWPRFRSTRGPALKRFGENTRQLGRAGPGLLVGNGFGGLVAFGGARIEVGLGLAGFTCLVSTQPHEFGGACVTGGGVRGVWLFGGLDGYAVGLGGGGFCGVVGFGVDGEAEPLGCGRLAECGFEGFGDGVSSFGGEVPFCFGSNFGGMSAYDNFCSSGEGLVGFRHVGDSCFGGF